MLVNEILITKLKSLLHVATVTNLKTKILYKKILSELTEIREPITSKTQVRNIPSIGSKTADLLFDHLEIEFKSRIVDLDELEKYQLLLSVTNYKEIYEKLQENKTKKDDIEDCISDISNSDIDMISINKLPNSLVNIPGSFTYSNNKNKTEYLPPSKRKNVRISKKYVPGYRTGAYAILKALWLEDGISKHKIIHIGKNYSNTEFDLTSRNSAWSGMKTLIDKGLVYKETGSKKYFITLEGQDIANKLFQDTSIVQNTDTEPILLIDSREIKNRSYRSFFQNYFEGKSVNHDTRLLEVGDFAWIKNEMICDFIVERKCGSDFVSSISDGRFKEQKNRLKDTGISNIFYLIENLRISDFKNLNSEYGYYCMTSTKLEGFTVLETDDIKDTASVIEQIHNTVIKENNKIESDYKMSYGSFIEKGSKNKNMDVNQILLYCFSAISGINKDKAYMLTSHFKTLNNFYTIGLKNQLKDELSGLKLGLSKRNINDIIKLMFSPSTVEY